MYGRGQMVANARAFGVRPSGGRNRVLFVALFIFIKNHQKITKKAFVITKMSLVIPILIRLLRLIVKRMAHLNFKRIHYQKVVE